MDPEPPSPPRQLGNLRKAEFLKHFETKTEAGDYGRTRFNGAYRSDDLKFMRFLVPPGKRILELGCSHGDLLAALEPSYGVGVDFAPRTLDRARQRHPNLTFVQGDVEDPATLAANACLNCKKMGEGRRL